jgi:CheY-like chemotaxis protein
MQVADAIDALAGIDLLRRGIEEGDPFRIALVDRQMPGIDGLTLARMIRKDHALDGTAIVLLSGLDLLNGAELAGTGIGAVLPKPVRQGALRATLVGIIDQVGRKGGEAGAGGGERPPREIPERELRVLIAEDNQINQLVLEKMLTLVGHKVESVDNGADALAALGEVPYDVVLMDCQMPVMDGYEATRQLRSREGEGRRTVVIAVTANAFQEDVDKCRECGMDDYLPKPIRKEDLYAMLRKWSHPEPAVTNEG